MGWHTHKSAVHMNYSIIAGPSVNSSSGDGLVGGNPTMNTNTPRLRRGGGIASSSSLVLLVLVLLYSILCL